MTLNYHEKVLALKGLAEKVGSQWIHNKTKENFVFSDFFQGRVTLKDEAGYSLTMDSHFFVDEYTFKCHEGVTCNHTKIMEKYKLGDEAADKLKALKHLPDSEFDTVCKIVSELLARQIEECVEAYQSYFLETDYEENTEITEAISNAELL